MTKSKRTHFSQLPPNQELKKILDTESKRLPPTEKKFIHYLTFKEVAEWLKAVRLDDELFIGNPKIEKILEIGEKLQQKVVQKTLRGISIADKNLLASLSKITDYMNLEHQPQKSDLV